MNQLIAFCGLDCAKCDAYIATQANDEAAKERVVAKWRIEFNAPNMTVADATCDGCVAVSGRTGGYCAECPIRVCGREHQLANCAYCLDYAGCEKLANFFSMAPAAKATLDELRLTL